MQAASLPDLPVWSPPTSEPEILSPLASSVSSVDDTDNAIFTIYDLLLQRAKTVPDHPLVGYPDAALGAAHYSYYSATDLTRFAEGAAKDLIFQGLPEQVNYLSPTLKL